MIKNKKSVMEMCGISRKSSPLNEKIPTEKLEEVVVKAPKNTSRIFKRDGDLYLTAEEAQELDRTGSFPKSFKDKEFRDKQSGDFNRKKQ